MSDLEEVARELASTMAGQRFGSTEVETVDVDVDSDADNEVAVYLWLTLSDPKGSTWPYDDVLMLRRSVLQAASEAGLSAPVYVRLAPATDDPQADDDLQLKL